MDQLLPFLFGVVSTASAAVGTFFYRFWRRTHDQLFLAFAVAFGLMSANWAVQAFVPLDESYYAAIYLLRLAAFAVIIAGVVRKNRRAARPANEAAATSTAAPRFANAKPTVAGVIAQRNGADPHGCS